MPREPEEGSRNETQDSQALWAELREELGVDTVNTVPPTDLSRLLANKVSAAERKQSRRNEKFSTGNTKISRA